MYVQAWNWYGSDILYHHGIMGQKWGKKNGPPYPLAPSDHSSAEKKLYGQNDGKLESWKRKENGKINKKYGRVTTKLQKKIDRVNKKIEKSESEGKQDSKLNQFNKLSAARLTREKAILEASKLRESLEINNYTLSDVRKEKLYVGKQFTKNALITVGTAILPVHVISYSTPEQLKTHYRTVEHPKLVEREKQKREAAEETSINGIGKLGKNDVKKNRDKEQKSIDKADKDFDRDFNTIKLQYYSSMRGRLRQKDVDAFEYRHDAVMADAAYGDHYNKRVKEAVKELKARGLRDELADEITKRMTLKVHHEQQSASSRAEQLLRPEYEKTGKVSDKTLLRAIKEDKSLRNEAKQEASSVRKYEPATVQKARSMRRRGMSYNDIGEQLGLDNWTIWALVNEE